MAGRRGWRQGCGLEGSVLYGWAMIFPIPAMEGSLVHVGDVQFRTAGHSVRARYGWGDRCPAMVRICSGRM